jgi:hypothetical protein
MILKKAGIYTSFALIGKFLELKGQNVGSAEHCQRFYLWLKDIGVNSSRADVVMCIAEKADLIFPGIYDREIYKI